MIIKCGQERTVVDLKMYTCVYTVMHTTSIFSEPTPTISFSHSSHTESAINTSRQNGNRLRLENQKDSAV